MEPNNEYKIFNEEIEFKLKELGDVIQGQMPPGWGFFLLLFDFNAGPNGSLFFTTSGNKQDMINMMKEYIKLYDESPPADTTPKLLGPGTPQEP